VLVNGGPLELPAPARRLVGLPPFAQLLRALFRWSSYSPKTLTRAFADPSRAPAALVGALAGRHGDPPGLELLGQLLRAEEPQRPLPRRPTLLLWGIEDRLPGVSVKAATRLQCRIPDAELVLVPDAGHMPQVEQPGRFIEALCRFVEERRHLGA
jgi:2-hydroxy-6-oxonona-2,4-dienedioate hydrolase